MKAILTRVAFSARLSTLMISCSPNENAEKRNQNSAPQGSAATNPTVMINLAELLSRPVPVLLRTCV